MFDRHFLNQRDSPRIVRSAHIPPLVLLGAEEGDAPKPSLEPQVPQHSAPREVDNTDIFILAYCLWSNCLVVLFSLFSTFSFLPRGRWRVAFVKEELFMSCNKKRVTFFLFPATLTVQRDRM